MLPRAAVRENAAQAWGSVEEYHCSATCGAYSIKYPLKETCMEKRIGNIVFFLTVVSAIYVTFLTL